LFVVKSNISGRYVGHGARSSVSHRAATVLVKDLEKARVFKKTASALAHAKRLIGSEAFNYSILPVKLVLA